MNRWVTVVVVANTVSLVAGGLITTYAWRAYRRTRSPALYSLALGLGLVTLGALVAGGLHQFTGVHIDVSLAVQSAFSALGFVTLALSLYTSHETRPQTVTSEAAATPRDR